MPAPDWLSDAIAAICEPRFATTMLEVVDRHVMHVDHCAVVRLLRASVAQVFTNATIASDTDHATAAIRYIDGSRGLEIKLAGPLDRFRTVKVDLLEGILSNVDNRPLAPFTLTFTTGG